MLIKYCSELLKDLQLSHFELLIFEALGITLSGTSVFGMMKMDSENSDTFPSMLLMYTKLIHLSIMVRVKASKRKSF